MTRPRLVHALLVTTTVLLASALYPLCASAQLVVFEDNFDGASLGPAWTAADNGFVAPAITVAGGFVELGSFNGGAAFPYVINAQPFYPTIECLNVKIISGIQYNPSAGGNGDGFVVLGGSNEELFMVWRDAEDELFTQLNAGSTAAVAGPTGAHEYAMSITGTQVEVLVDGATNGLMGTLPATPAKIWFGHPTTGQVFSMAAADAPPSMGHVAADGTVTSAWWMAADYWSSFKVDFVRVECIPPTIITDGNNAGSSAVTGTGSPCDALDDLKVVIYDCGTNPADCAGCSPYDAPNTCPNMMLGMGTKDPTTGAFMIGVSGLQSGHYIYASDGCTEQPFNIGEPAVVLAATPAPLLSPRMVVVLAVLLAAIGLASLSRLRKSGQAPSA